MIIYIFVFSLVALLGFLEMANLQRKAIMFFAVITLACIWLFQSLRWTTGTDWSPYFTFFTRTEGFDGFMKADFEKGYSLLNYVVQYISNSYTFFLSVFCALFATLNAKYIVENSPFIFPVLLFTFSTMIFPVRQDLAVIIIYAGYVHLWKRNAPKFLIFVLMASMIHRTAIIFLPIYFISHYRYKSWQLLAVYIIGMLLGVTGFFTDTLMKFVLPNYGDMGDVLSEKVQTIVTNNELVLSPARLILSFLNGSVWLIFFLWMRNKISDSYTKQYNVFLNLYTVSLFVNRLFLTSLPEFARFALYFGGGFAILLSIVLKNSEVKYRALLFSFFILFCFMKMQENIKRFPDLFLPYVNIFSGYDRSVY